MSKGLEVGKAMSLSLNNRLALRLRPFGPAPGVIPGRNGRVARYLMSLGCDHYYDPSARLTDGQLMPNLIQLGADPAQLGSTPEADSNDPVWLRALPHDSVWFPGSAGNTASHDVPVPSHTFALLGFELELDSVGSVTATNYLAQVSTSTSIGHLLALQHVSGDRYRLLLREFTTVTDHQSDLTDLPAGMTWQTVRQVRVQFDLVAGEGRAEFAGPDGQWHQGPPWIQALGTAPATTTAFRFTVGGAFTLANPAIPMRVSGGHVFSEAGTVKVFDPADLDGWSITRSAAGLKAAVVPAGRGVLVLDAVNDYVQLGGDATPAFSATAGDFTVLMSVVVDSAPGETKALWDCRSGSTSGAYVGLSASGAILGRVQGSVGGLVGSMTSVVAFGAPVVVGMRVTSGSVEAFHVSAGSLAKGNAASFTGSGAIGFFPPRVGAPAYGVVSVPGVEVLGFAQAPVALADAEIVAAAKALLNGEVTL